MTATMADSKSKDRTGIEQTRSGRTDTLRAHRTENRPPRLPLYTSGTCPYFCVALLCGSPEDDVLYPPLCNTRDISYPDIAYKKGIHLNSRMIIFADWYPIEVGYHSHHRRRRGRGASFENWPSLCTIPTREDRFVRSINRIIRQQVSSWFKIPRKRIDHRGQDWAPAT